MNMQNEREFPCEGKGFSYPVGHCKPPVGYNEQGHDCSNCSLKQMNI